MSNKQTITSLPLLVTEVQENTLRFLFAIKQQGDANLVFETFVVDLAIQAAKRQLSTKKINSSIYTQGPAVIPSEMINVISAMMDAKLSQRGGGKARRKKAKRKSWTTRTLRQMFNLVDEYIQVGGKDEISIEEFATLNNVSGRQLRYAIDAFNLREEVGLVPFQNEKQRPTGFFKLHTTLAEVEKVLLEAGIFKVSTPGNGKVNEVKGSTPVNGALFPTS